MPFEKALTTDADLRSVYREPAASSVAKQIDHIDEHCRDFIRRSPFMLFATGHGETVDVSPRGGHPGFVKVLDDHRLAFPDLAGNNRLDSLRNVVASGGVGLLFLIPGLDETLRVNGVATVTTDDGVLQACVDGDLVPRVAIGVDVEEAFIHCAKAFRRSGLWQPDGWGDLSDMATAACMLRDHTRSSLDVATVEARLAESYEHRTWVAGGG